MPKFKIKKGDHVVVITGKDRGKKGEVLKMLPDEKRAVVSGVAMVRRHQKQTAAQEGGIIAKEAPIHISNVMLWDGKQGAKVRRDHQNDKKVRISKKSGEVIK